MGGSIDFKITRVAQGHYSAAKISSDDTGLHFQTAPVSSQVLAEGLTFTAGGNVGIGTTTPWGQLSASSTSAYPSLAVQQNSTGAAATFLGGNVGIGTTSPSAKLAITDTSGATSRVIVVSGTSGNETFSVLGSGNVTVGNTVSNYTNGARLSFGGNIVGLRASASGNDQLTILNGGNVGIGSTTPYAKLSVKGAGSTTGVNFQTTNSSDSPLFTILDSGNVGIGVEPSSVFRTIVNGTADSNAGTATGIFSVRSSATNALNIGALSGAPFGLYLQTNNTSYPLIFQPAGGKTGVATTTPWRTLSVTGTVGFDGLTAGAGAGSLCLTANREVVYSDNAGCTGSSQRFKHDIVSLDSASGLEEVMGLNPVSFVYNDDIGVSGEQVGFIAEDVAQVDQRLVTYDASGTPNNVKYSNMVAIAIKAIKELASTVSSFADRFTTNELHFTRADGDQITTQKLCIGQTCVTETQLQALLAGAGSEGGTGSPPPGSDDEEIASDTEPPVIAINGNNPATLQIGDTYSDLGATVTDNVDQNLGYETFVGETPIEWAHVDTSEPNEWHIHYVATDSAGNTATSTRTVIVEGPSILPKEPPAETPAP